MAATTSPIIPELSIIRARGEGEQRATFFELFFDLVYVFAVTQLSHHLLGSSQPSLRPVTAGSRWTGRHGLCSAGSAASAARCI